MQLILLYLNQRSRCLEINLKKSIDLKCVSIILDRQLCRQYRHLIFSDMNQNYCLPLFKKKKYQRSNSLFHAYFYVIFFVCFFNCNRLLKGSRRLLVYSKKTDRHPAGIIKGLVLKTYVYKLMKLMINLIPETYHLKSQIERNLLFSVDCLLKKIFKSKDWAINLNKIKFSLN